MFNNSLGFLIAGPWTCKCLCLNYYQFFFLYRTARGKNQGAALSFISIAEMQRFENIKQQLADEYSEL